MYHVATQLYSKAGKFREMSGKWGHLHSSAPFVFIRIEIFSRNSSIRLLHWLEISNWIIHNVSMALFFKYLSNQFLFLLSNGQIPSSAFYWTNVLLKFILYTNASPIVSVVARFKDGHQWSLSSDIHILVQSLPHWPKVICVTMTEVMGFRFWSQTMKGTIVSISDYLIPHMGKPDATSWGCSAALGEVCMDRNWGLRPTAMGVNLDTDPPDPADILTDVSQEALSQNQPPKQLPNSWSTEVVR